MMIALIMWSNLPRGAATIPIDPVPAVPAVPDPNHSRSYLHIAGSHLVRADGREVALHGINVGGWLVTEDWMCGFADSRDPTGAVGGGGRSALESLEARFGAKSAAALMDVWRDHWITGGDLDRIRDGGFNLIRVPISYRTLQHEDGSWILDAHGQIDFTRMDWIVREAARRGIYTVFDLHVWPGQRLAYEQIGRADGKPAREAMAALWTAVAAHYRGNGAIAALDLINEFPGAWGVQQRLARAVSDGDPERLQIVEGFTYPEFLKLHAAGAFPNSIFSDHFYAAQPLTTDEIAARLKPLAQSPVPVYIGEFLAADFAAATTAMNQAGAAWSSWTYKTVNMGEWGTFNYYPTLKTDIQIDTYQNITTKWNNQLTQWQKRNKLPNYAVNEGRLNIAFNGSLARLR